MFTAMRQYCKILTSFKSFYPSLYYCCCLGMTTALGLDIFTVTVFLQRSLKIEKESHLQETRVRRINAAVWQQAMKGNIAVNHDGSRVFRAKTVKGQLKVKHSDSRWHNATHVDIS